MRADTLSKDVAGVQKRSTDVRMRRKNARARSRGKSRGKCFGSLYIGKLIHGQRCGLNITIGGQIHPSSLGEQILVDSLVPAHFTSGELHAIVQVP